MHTKLIAPAKTIKPLPAFTELLLRDHYPNHSIQDTIMDVSAFQEAAAKLSYTHLMRGIKAEPS
jgi:hypothetical protein